MNKKTFHKRSLKTEKEDESLDDQESRDLLKNIYAKLDVSPALNGGFDKLLFNVDNIEKRQTQIIEKVDKIHEAIYDPDDGQTADYRTRSLVGRTGERVLRRH